MSLPAGTATTSISGMLNRKTSASPERIANRGALFLCHSSPLSVPESPYVAPCWGLRGWVGKALAPHRRGPCWGFVGLAWASHRIADFGAVYARSEKKLSTESKVKQEKGGGVAMLPTSRSQRPAKPVVSRDSGLSRVQVKIGLLIPRFPENRVAIPIIGCVTAKNQGLL